MALVFTGFSPWLASSVVLRCSEAPCGRMVLWSRAAHLMESGIQRERQERSAARYAPPKYTDLTDLLPPMRLHLQKLPPAPNNAIKLYICLWTSPVIKVNCHSPGATSEAISKAKQYQCCPHDFLMSRVQKVEFLSSLPGQKHVRRWQQASRSQANGMAQQTMPSG